MQGDTRELTTIDPRIRIYHDCNDMTGVVENVRRKSQNTNLKKINKYIKNR